MKTAGLEPPGGGPALHRVARPSRATTGRLTFAVLLSLLAAVSIAPSGCDFALHRVAPVEELEAGVGPLGARMLFVAPRPDDEGLAGAGLIRRSLARGIDVRVLVVTAGDASIGAARALSGNPDPTPQDYRKVGEARMLETRSALRALGLPARSMTYLAYADGSVNSLWDDNWDYDRPRIGHNGSDHAPYACAYQRNAPYCGENLARNLQEVIRDYDPTSIFYPYEQDAHHDH